MAILKDLRLKQRLSRLTIFQRIAIGNSLVIAIGAIGGTLITRLLTDKAADIWLIILFTVVGTTLSVLINSLIVSSALHPLYELRRLVERSHGGLTQIDLQLLKETDPDINQLATALNSLVMQLEERNRQLRALSQRAINAQEEERRRIALSLHDDTGQSLTTLIIHLDRIENRLPKDQTDLKARLIFARKLASDTLEELRKIIYGLRPAILDDLGLVPAIRWYARSNLEPQGIQVKVVAPEEQNLPDDLTTTLFRISQETINNIARHSQARNATISLLNEKERVLLKVNDDGRGFDVTESSGQALRLQRLGLLGIQERAELVGGEVTVESAPGQGTEIQVMVPLAPESNGQDE